MQGVAYAVNTLDDINDVRPRAAADEACLAEVAEVLKRHGLASRWGVSLLHKHFDLADDELLVEVTYLNDQRQVNEPVKICDIAAEGLITTAYRFDNPSGAMECYTSCLPMPFGTSPGHTSTHKSI